MKEGITVSFKSKFASFDITAPTAAELKEAVEALSMSGHLAEVAPKMEAKPLLLPSQPSAKTPARVPKRLTSSKRAARSDYLEKVSDEKFFDIEELFSKFPSTFKCCDVEMTKEVLDRSAAAGIFLSKGSGGNIIERKSIRVERQAKDGGGWLYKVWRAKEVS